MSTLVERATTAWRANPCDETCDALSAAFRKTGDTYSAIEHHMGLRSEFFEDSKKFCAAIDEVMKINSSEKQLRALMSEIDSEYLDEKFNIAFYLFLQNNNIKTYDEFDKVTDEIAALTL